MKIGRIIEFIWFGLLSLGIYFKLWRSYFTQDEWYYFTLFHKYVDSPLGFISVFVDQFRNVADWGIHITPLWNSLFFLEYQLFGLKYQYWALLAIVLHVISAFSVSVLIRRLTSSTLLAVTAGTFFAISSTHTEAVTWANTNVQTQLPLIIVCWALTAWLEWTQKGKIKYAVLSLSMFLLSLLIRENVLGILVLLPVITFLYGNRKRLRQSIVMTIVPLISYVVYRIGFIRVVANRQGGEFSQSIPTGIFDIGAFIFRLPFYTAKTVVHQFVGPEIIQSVSEFFTILNYPSSYAADRLVSGPTYGAFIHSAGTDIATILLAIPVFIVLFLFWNTIRKRQPRVSKSILFAILFVTASLASWVLLVPYLLTLMPSMPLVPSRQLYFATVGTGFLAALVIGYLYQRVMNGSGLRKSIALAGLVAFLLWLGREGVLARNVIATDVIEIGEQRRIITDYTKAVYPTIDDKTIFYVTSNRQYFGFASMTVPFQTNFGSTLLEMYRSKKQYPEYFPKYFIEIGPLGQGYVEQNGVGFGYYYDGKTMISDIDRFNLSPENVVAFHYNGDSKVFQVMTDEIRERINKEYQYSKQTSFWKPYKEVESPMWFVVPSENTVRRNSGSDNVRYDFVSNTTGISQYRIEVYQNTGQVQIDDFIENYKIKNGISDENVDSSNRTIYFDTLTTVQSVRLELIGRTVTFFRHPTTYLITVIVNNTSVEETYPEDLFFWSIRLK